MEPSKKMEIIPLTRGTMMVFKDQDVVPFRNEVKEYAERIKMGLVNQTKLITAASEMVRNMLKYANGGLTIIEIVSRGPQSGVRVTFKDEGPGIADIPQAMQDGFSTGKSLGLGLPGTKRLVNEFDIKSIPGTGTTITIIKWANG
ncbi:anti-sigma regulatory factor [Pedobacter hartonius]|uniref:Serine/threonine-protein kinase RsbT n=1 Tax=Pedobacter hartonius TaxID=425514 RepID=A0A1H4H993_9SPHI|nr:anti-sigma regulatory factor [Pedobacter hartonius]SEB18211.1 serine/threonine-protein kinase RsbT [Pedobacter hartonius]